MTVTIPIWFFWMIGIPFGICVAVCAALGFMFIIGGGGGGWQR